MTPSRQLPAAPARVKAKIPSATSINTNAGKLAAERAAKRVSGLRAVANAVPRRFNWAHMISHNANTLMSASA